MYVIIRYIQVLRIVCREVNSVHAGKTTSGHLKEIIFNHPVGT